MAKKSVKPCMTKPLPQKERKLYHGESVAWLPAPNNLVPTHVATEESRTGPSHQFARYRMWPLIAATTRPQDRSQDNKPIFVDEFYGVKHWEDWVNHAPTWMDPHLFIRMAMEDERVQKILRVSFHKNDPDAWERLLPLFQEILDSKYLPYVIERFERDAAAVMAHWLIRNNAQECLDEAERQKELARRRRPQ